MGGRLSDKLGRRPVMIGGLVLFILYLTPMFQLLSSNNIVLIFVAFAVGLMIHSTLFGPLAAFVSEQFGTTSRYTGASLGYQLATLLGAGFTPGIVAQIFKDSGQDTASVVWYLAIMSVVSIVFILLTREPKNNDLQTVQVLTPGPQAANRHNRKDLPWRILASARGCNVAARSRAPKPPSSPGTGSSAMNSSRTGQPGSPTPSGTAAWPRGTGLPTWAKTTLLPGDPLCRRPGRAPSSSR